MIDLIGVDIPRLKRRSQDRRERAGALAVLFARAAATLGALRAAGAFQPALAAGLAAGAVLSAGPAVRHWLSAPRLDVAHSTIHPETRPESARLELAAQASRGELRWDAPAPGAMAEEFAAEPARRGEGWSFLARARSRSALGQARAALVLSRAAEAAAAPEEAAQASEGAFAQQWTAAGRDRGELLDSLSSARLLTSAPAPDVTLPGRNATPYQEMLDAAYAEAAQAGRLGRKAPVSLALGGALTAAGKAMLGVPGASLAARGLLASGAAALERGLTQQQEARSRLARARRLAADLSLLEGQKAQSALASACVEALAAGAALERCRGEAPPMTADVRASVDRELADDPVWEVEGGGRLRASAD